MKIVSKLSDVNFNEDTALGRAEMYVYIYPGIQSSSIVALPRSHSLSRNLYIRIYSKPVVIGVKFNEESFKKGPETLQSFLYAP